MREYEDSVKKVLCNITGIKEQDIQLDMKLSELGIDSLKNVELAITLEDELNIQFDDSLLIQKNFETVESLIRLVEKTVGR